jgi:hypothetical protein
MLAFMTAKCAKYQAKESTKISSSNFMIYENKHILAKRYGVSPIRPILGV